MAMVKKDHVQVTVVLPADLWKRIRVAAVESDTNASAMIAEVMSAHLEKKKAKSK